jgi:hypothetical protein
MNLLIVENNAKFNHPPNTNPKPISIVFTSNHHLTLLSASPRKNIYLTGEKTDN